MSIPWRTRRAWRRWRSRYSRLRSTVERPRHRSYHQGFDKKNLQKTSIGDKVDMLHRFYAIPVDKQIEGNTVTEYQLKAWVDTGLSSLE